MKAAVGLACCWGCCWFCIGVPPSLVFSFCVNSFRFKQGKPIRRDDSPDRVEENHEEWGQGAQIQSCHAFVRFDGKHDEQLHKGWPETVEQSPREVGLPQDGE